MGRLLDIADGAISPTNQVAQKAQKAQKPPLNALNALNAQSATSEKADQPERMEALPLADKLRIYGKPWPLAINGEVVAWLVPNDAAAKDCHQAEPVYTAAEVDHLVTLPAEDVQQLHKVKARFGGTIYPPEGNATHD